jgi:hypothetical protein
MRDDFNLIIDLIATNATFTSELMRIQDNFSRNSLHLLTIVRDSMTSLIIEKHPNVEKNSAKQVASYLSGLHAYEMRQKLNYIKKRLPHFSRWFLGAMSNNTVVELFDMDSKINTATAKIFDEIADKDCVIGEFDSVIGETTEEAKSEYDRLRDRIALLDYIKTLHCKSNRTVSDVVKKHFGIDELSDAQDVVDAMQKGTIDATQ